MTISVGYYTHTGLDRNYSNSAINYLSETPDDEHPGVSQAQWITETAAALGISAQQ